MKFEEVLITPEMAATYLTKNEGNRRLNMTHVRKLAKDMMSDNWSYNGDTIRFSSEGRLLDGQHRLNAIIRAERPVKMLVITGIDDPNAFKTIDTNSMGRNVSQILGLMGIKQSSLMSSVARRLTHWDNMVDHSNFGLTDRASFRFISTAEVIEYVEKNEHEIYDMISRVKNTLVFARCAAGSSLVATLIICNRYNEEKTQEMVHILTTGHDELKDSAVIKLRDKLLTPPDRRGHKWDVEIMALTIKAFNRHIHGKPAKYLKWTTEGKLPEKFPEIGELSRAATREDEKTTKEQDEQAVLEFLK